MPAPLADYHPATSPVLVEALIREGGGWGLDEVTELGAISGGAQAQRWGELADRNRPILGAQAQRWGELADRNRLILHTHDRYGLGIDEIESDPALARTGWCQAASSSEPPTSMGLACRPVGAWRRHLVKQIPIYIG